MTTPQLDMNRSYGTIHPPMDGAFYEQDGYLFGNDKRFLRDPAGRKGPGKPGPKSVENANVDVPKAIEPENDKIDLGAWAKGEQKAPFFNVKAAAKEMFPDAEVNDKADIVALLVDNGMITPSEAKV